MTTAPTGSAGTRAQPNWAYAVLLLILLLTGISTWFVNDLTRKQQQADFLQEADTITRTLTQRVRSYTDVMRATRALWTLDPTIDVVDFARYVDSVELERGYPGVQGLGFATFVRPGDEAAFRARMTEQFGEPFEIRPADASGPKVPVTLLEPRDAANTYARGFDMYSEARRRAAIDRARDTGDVAATAPVTLVQEDTKAERQAGLLLYLPVYREGVRLRTVEDRREALLGFVYAPLRAGDFLRGVIPANLAGLATLTVTDGDEPLFAPSSVVTPLTVTKVVDVGGRSWTLRFDATSAVGRDVFALGPWITMLAGFSIALLAFRLTHAQVTGRRRAEELNARLAVSRTSLDEARAEFEAIFRAMQDTAVFADPQGRVRLSNAALERTFGFRPDDLRGRSLATLHADGQIGEGTDDRTVTTTYRRRDGSEFVGEGQRSLVRSETGAVIGQLEVVRDMTERLEAERALRQSELRYRGVLEAVPHLVWVTDPEGRHLYFNSGWYDYTGLSHEASMDYGFANALHPDDVPRTLAAWERSWRYLEPYDIEYRFRRHDGVYHWFVGRATPIRDAQGQVIEWVGTCTDIHDRFEFEQQLLGAEARSRGLLEGLPQIVWVADPTGRTTWFNRRLAEYAGPDRAADGAIEPLLHPDDRASFRGRWDRAIASGTPIEGEYRLLSAGGEYRTFALRGLPVRTQDGGETIEWVGTFTDVDDQVYAETSSRLLADVSRQLATPLGEARDITGILALLVERFSESACLWLADGGDLWTAREARPHVDLAALDDAIGADVVRAALTSDETTVLGPSEPLVRAGLGGAAIVPLVARGERHTGALVLGYRREVDDRDLELAHEVATRLATSIDNARLFMQARDAEREVKELNQNLEHRVELRTLELQEANRELEAFSYSVSHDLRTPLRHIVGFGDLLRKEADDAMSDKGKRYLTIMTDAATRMSALIDDLLNFSRMGRQEIRNEDVHLSELVREVIEELSPETQDRDVKWNVEALPVVTGDPNLLKLVFINLLSNALKYSRTRDRAEIGVTAHAVDGETVITVRDNGVGFDSRFKDKLFGVFQRLHRAEEFEGTGIGLANVRRIITRHGGRVWAESELGEGATFSFALPSAGTVTSGRGAA